MLQFIIVFPSCHLDICIEQFSLGICQNNLFKFQCAIVSFYYISDMFLVNSLYLYFIASLIRFYLIFLPTHIIFIYDIFYLSLHCQIPVFTVNIIFSFLFAYLEVVDLIFIPHINKYIFFIYILIFVNFQMCTLILLLPNSSTFFLLSPFLFSSIPFFSYFSHFYFHVFLKQGTCSISSTNTNIWGICCQRFLLK